MAAVWLRAQMALAVAAVATLLWNARAAVGVIAGGFWNLANLWCLERLLSAWLRPQPARRRALGWVLVKFPLLYLVAFMLFRASFMSLVGFGIGFTVVLAVAIWWFAVRARSTTRSGPYQAAEKPMLAQGSGLGAQGHACSQRRGRGLLPPAQSPQPRAKPNCSEAFYGA